jgi:thiamine monophosphate kinase
MDNSDGLYPSLETLGSVNDVGVEVDFDDAVWHPAVAWAAQALGVEPLRFALGWGDWQLIITFQAEAHQRIRAALARVGIDLMHIGNVSSAAGTILRHGRERGLLAPIDSQRFAADSWFSAGLGVYEEALLAGPLIQHFA